MVGGGAGTSKRGKLVMDKTTLSDDGTSFDLGDLHFESLANGGMF